MSKVLQKGKFIVLEGLDRSGKSSVCKYLQHQLNNTTQTLLISFPDRTTAIGKMINNFLKNQVQLGNQAIHLLFSANRWQNMEKINDHLEKGITIICDRYWYSGVAYSAAKGLDLDWCINSDKGLLEPDLIIYLKADPQQLSKRQSYGQQRFQKLDFQKKVKEGFQKLLLGQKVSNKIVKLIQIGNKTLQQVENEVGKIILELMKQTNS